MFRMYNGQHDEEYHLMDSLVEEQYLIGGVTAWLYAYQGPKGNNGSEDATKPDYDALGSKITDIGNYVWMETSDRSYSVDAVELPVVYQTKDASMEMQIPGLFLFETMEITMPYTLMVQRLGRKVMKGDVLELANLRDTHLLDEDSDAINRFYVVHDAFKSGDGYSHTWFHHIWKLRVVPMTDSPEFRDLLGDGSNEYDLVNSMSTRQRELDIMDLIVGQADSEVPYMHFDNEHIHEARTLPDETNTPSGYSYPANPSNGDYFIKKTLPELYEYDEKWIEIPVEKGETAPISPEDGDFFWHLHWDHIRPLVLVQYDANKAEWYEVSVESGTDIPEKITPSGFFRKEFADTPIQIYTVDGWETAVDEYKPNYVDNKYNHQDQREALPDMSKVVKGEQFPMNPEEDTWFLRTDQNPQTLWKFENSKWRKFNYGGRLQWTGTDAHKASFVNNRDTYTDGEGNTQPSRVSSANIVKPNIDD